MTLLRLENVVQRYREQASGRFVQALRVHELSVSPGEILSVVGPNGSGKSTLLEMLAFLRPPAEGRVLLEGADVWEQGGALAARRRTPMLLQKTVLFSGTVERNVGFGLRARGIAAAECRRRAREALELVGMERLAHRRHGELSGGEQRRVALARILALRSPIIVLDEPTAGLDHEAEAAIEELIVTVNREHGTTVVLASHNNRQAVALGSRVVTLMQGRLLPEAADNVLTGTLRLEGEHLLFTSRSGLRLSLEDRHVTTDAWLGAELEHGHCVVSVSASGFRIVDDEFAESAVGPGVVESVRQEHGTCRLRVRLDSGAHLHASVSMARYTELGLNLGSSIRLALDDGAVRPLPPPGATAE